MEPKPVAPSAAPRIHVRSPSATPPPGVRSTVTPRLADIEAQAQSELQMWKESRDAESEGTADDSKPKDDPKGGRGGGTLPWMKRK